MFRYFKIIFTIVLLSIFFIPLGPLASIGSLLNPYSGIWQPTTNDFENLPAALKLKVKDKVVVKFEKTGIPHIFAQSDSDLYFTQGYLEARDRLWSMDFISRVASGRLSEIFGKKTLDVDETFVQLRIPEAAETSLQFVREKDPETFEALTQFSEGANFFIENLKDENLALEFKLFNYRPEKWSPLKCILLEKFMAFNLASWSKDLQMTRNRSILSKEDFEQLFPADYPFSESIISEDHQWDFKSRAPLAPTELFQATLQNQKLKLMPNPSNGSNNWAVFGKKSSTGYPIVSNDIHLDYSQPSLWYQMQLISPTQNVYGVSLAGAPGVVIGFSKNLTWAVTNASGDFMDWYELKFKDDTHKEYLFDNKWMPVTEHEHTILIKGSSPLKLKLKDTHFGPLVFDDQDANIGLKNFPHGFALRWTALAPSNELKSLMKLNHAKNLKDCDEAFSDYHSPSQNFICADSEKQVKMGIRGDYPLRYRGQGQMVSDGSKSSEQWSGRLTESELPQETNPPRNYVFSANQKPVSAKYPYYLGQYYEPPFRAQRISQLLSEKPVWTPEELRDMQRDTYNKLAEKVLPILISELKKNPKNDQAAIGALSEWNFRNESIFVGPTIFEHLWNHLERDIWSKSFPDPINYAYPNSFMLSELIKKDLHSKWLNPKNLSFNDILDESFKECLSDLRSLYGENIQNWKWKHESVSVINHLSKLPIFSNIVDSQGSRYNIMANHMGHGPVWKMLVSLGPDFKAWGIYPGGQSGDLRSPHAKEFVEDWAQSKLRPLTYLEDPKLVSFKEVVFESEGH